MYKIGNATIRIHGKPDPDKLHTATQKFLKKVEQQRKRCEQSKQEKSQQESNAS